MNRKQLFLLSFFISHALFGMEGTIETLGFVSNFVPPSPTNPQQACFASERTVEPLGRRLFNIYLPPGYDPDDTTTSYPVVYWCIGFNGFNESATNNNIQGILNEFINNGQIMPMIVVFPDPSLDLTFRFPDPQCDFPPGNECELSLPDVPEGVASYGNSFYINSELNDVQYEDYFIQELIPFVDANFNTIADRNFRAIAGHSMGGYAAVLLGLRHPDVFAGFAGESPTAPYTFTQNQFFNPQPSYPAFTLNSIFIGGILKNPEGKVSPCNEGLTGSVGFQDFIFALSGALSPNPTGGTSFLDEFQVDLPIIVNPDGTPSLIDGTFSVIDVFNPSFCTTVPKSVVLDQSVIERWEQNDPFFLLESNVDSLSKQAIYLDGGFQEPWNVIASRQMSDILMANTIDNEYVCYCGNHTTWLFDPCCSRQTQVFKMFSSKFSTAGVCPEQASAKLVGNMNIELEDDAQINVQNGSILSVQTTRTPPIIDETNVTFKLKDNAALHIGTQDSPGGAFQIGDPFTKAQLQLFNTGPENALADHTVDCTICLDGNNALFEIGKEGFFGIGMGINGKSNKNIPLAPEIANFWSVTSLANVNHINILLNKGIFSHQVIASGDTEPASLLGIDLCNQYQFSINVPCAQCLGGANVICTQQNPIENTICPGGSSSSSFVNRQVHLLHPTITNIANNLPRAIFGAQLTNPAGIINRAQFDPDQLDAYYDNNVSSSTIYTNIIKRGIFKSTAEFDRGNVPDPFTIDTTDLDAFCEFLTVDIYEEQPIKLANLSTTPETKIAYLQNASFIENMMPFESALISRPEVDEQDPNVTEINTQMIDTGVAGIQLEFDGTKANIPDEDITNVKALINVYNAHKEA